MKQLLIGIGITLLSGLIGSGYAIHKLRTQSRNKNFTIQNGSWSVNPKMDLSNRYQRALVALVGLFALRESEVLYFVANQDSEGKPLNSRYDYVLEGTAPDARYWSYTL